MTTRRSFIKTTTILSAGVLIGRSGCNEKSKTIGLQLYTVRDAMAKDPQATLARVASIGYNSVETATYTGSQKFYGMTPKEFAETLKKNGLIAPSGHYQLGEAPSNEGTILHGWDKAVDDAAAAGIKYMVCAYLFPEERGNLDHYKKVADELNAAGERCKKSGIQLCYHNHDFEFEAQDGKYPYDILLGTDPNLVKMEIDLYWLTKAGQDPVALINKHPGRFPLWHVKDMDNTAKKFFTEVGSGVIDFKRIFAVQQTAGLKYYFVEQDQTPGDPFDSIQKSINNIKATFGA